MADNSHSSGAGHCTALPCAFHDVGPFNVAHSLLLSTVIDSEYVSWVQFRWIKGRGVMCARTLRACSILFCCLKEMNTIPAIILRAVPNRISSRSACLVDWYLLYLIKALYTTRGREFGAQEKWCTENAVLHCPVLWQSRALDLIVPLVPSAIR